MQICHLRVVQQPLQVNLAGRGIQQIRTSHHVRYSLRRVVHHHCQLIGPDAIGPQQNKIPAVFRQVERALALHMVLPGNFFVANLYPPSPGWPSLQTMPASASVGSLAYLFACASTAVYFALPLQPVQSFGIEITALALPQNSPVPAKPMRLQSA